MPAITTVSAFTRVPAFSSAVVPVSIATQLVPPSSDRNRLPRSPKASSASPSSGSRPWKEPS
jgi:hypothetical protein